MFYLTVIGAVFLTWMIVVTLFTPAVPYHLEKRINPEDDHFINVLEANCQARLLPGNAIEIFTNGEAFYPAMLDAIAGAGALAERADETIADVAALEDVALHADAFARAGNRVEHRRVEPVSYTHLTLPTILRV